MSEKSFLFIFLIIFLFTPHFSYAQVKVLPNCPYKFSTELKMGDSHEDVVVLQEILNSDKRTIVALSGAGSPGKETGNFGPATRTALKKFQALFIEYIGVADGKFNEKTKTVAQAICDGTLDSVPQAELTSEQVETTKTPIRTATNTSPLFISIAANARSIAANTQLRVVINSSREIKTPDSGSIIVDGGSVSEIRKMSKTQYMAIIVASEGARQINIQVEADKISDLNGLTNDDASNEITVAVTASSIVSTINNAAGAISGSIENILNQISGITPTSKNCNGIQVAIETVCNSTIGTTGNTASTQPTNSAGGSGSSGGSGGGGSGGQNSLSQMLNSLMSGMTKGAQQQAPHDEDAAESNAQPYSPSTEPFTGGSVDLSSLNVPAFCKTPPNYGGKPAGQCFDMENTTPQVKEAVALACAAIGKPVPIVSASRNGKKCGNAGAQKSQHLKGMAVDIGHLQLTSVERQKVFEVFKKKGFNGYGCYGVNSPHGVHLDHGPARRWGPDKTGASWSQSHCPEELFLGGYPK